jgi:trk system potassium uptake protein TrkA
MVQIDRPVLGPKHILIVGCTELGTAVATALADLGNTVHILDTESVAFDRLSKSQIDEHRIVPFVGDGTSQENLLKADVLGVDVFMALTTHDTTNILTAQLAKHHFQVEVVVCRVDDSDLQMMYNDLGLIAIGANALLADTAIQAATA